MSFTLRPYPRSRGGTVIVCCGIDFTHGLSPLARGNRTRCSG